MIKIYCARAMTGLDAAEVVSDAKSDKDFLERAGFEVLCPVTSEGVKSVHKPIQSSKKQMDTYWSRDKQMIRDAHIVFDMSPHMNSEGVKHEIGYARYCLWKCVVRIFPPNKLPTSASVAFYEDDYLCTSLLEAVEYVYRVHGSLFRRFTWRLKMLNRCLVKWLKYQILEFK